MIALMRAKIRSLVSGWLQSATVEGHENFARNQVERWQDYGFAANPVDGEGLVIEVAGHTIILRMDRSSERPALAPHEVCVWHREGHKVTLKAGRVVHVEGAVMRCEMTERIELVAPSVTVGPTGSELVGHDHGGGVPPLT